MQFNLLEKHMIKKSFLLAGLIFTTSVLFAEGSLATLKYGLTSIDNEDGFDFSKHSFRIDAMFDRGYIIKPRVGFGYVSIDESAAEGGVSSLFQFDVEGVYEVESNYLLTPYLFAGAGYEHVTDARPNFDSQFYLDGGIGVRYPLPNEINLVTEFKGMHMLKTNSNQDAEFAFYIGIGMPFGRISRAPQDSDGDGIYDYADMCPNSPLGTQVGIDGCPIKQELAYKDSDGDTIPDSIDICPNTPAGVGVNDRGCPVRAAVEAKPLFSQEPEVLVETAVIDIPKGEVVKEVKEVIITDSDGDGVEDNQDQCANTPKGFSVNSIGCAVKKTLDVQFESNSFHVTPASKPRIKEFAQFLMRYPNAKVKIVGYSDSSGDRAKNKILSQKRAESVKQLLISYGIPAAKITAIGKGDLNPIATNDTPEGREKNRRIEAEIQ
jgi:OOP family OmpA-OmpF porin